MNPYIHYLGDSVYIQLYTDNSFVLFTKNDDGTPVQSSLIFFEKQTLDSLLLVLKSNNLIP